MGFRNITLKEAYEMARNSYEDIWDSADSVGRDVKIYLHWTAGHYHQPYTHYHFNIDVDGTIETDCHRLDEIKAHTWKRNTGAIGITFESSWDEDPDKAYPGSEPVTPVMIEAMSQLVAVLANALDLTIDHFRVMTHGEAADNKDCIYAHEPYGPESTWERHDIYLKYDDGSYRDGGEMIRGKANWYRQDWKEHPEHRPY